MEVESCNTIPTLLFCSCLSVVQPNYWSNICLMTAFLKPSFSAVLLSMNSGSKTKLVLRASFHPNIRGRQGSYPPHSTSPPFHSSCLPSSPRNRTPWCPCLCSKGKDVPWRQQHCLCMLWGENNFTALCLLRCPRLQDCDFQFTSGLQEFLQKKNSGRTSHS